MIRQWYFVVILFIKLFLIFELLILCLTLYLIIKLIIWLLGELFKITKLEDSEFFERKKYIALTNNII